MNKRQSRINEEDDENIPLDDPAGLDAPEAAPEMPGADETADLDELGTAEDAADHETEEITDIDTDTEDGAITGRYNASPVGDIKMTKVKGTYNTYKLELSMGQLEVIRSSLEANHSDPVSDELLATLSFYMDKLPGPGEDEEAEKKEDEGESPIPEPPSKTTVGAKDLAKLPPPEMPKEKPTKKAGPPPAPEFDEEEETSLEELPAPPSE